jgi:hypothetical protein
MFKNLKKFLSKIQWKVVLLSQTFVYGYPFVVLATIALAGGSLFAALAWIVWVVAIIVAIK